MEIDARQRDVALLVEDRDATIEKVAKNVDVLAAIAEWHFVGDIIKHDDVIARDSSTLGDDKVVLDSAEVGDQAQLALVFVPSFIRRGTG